VLFDVVYNHAGGNFGGDEVANESFYFFDRYFPGNNNNSLYFTNEGFAGGLVFAYWNQGVTQFLIDNAKFWLEEAHADGFRYDEVSAISNFGGRAFCQELTGTVRHVKPSGPQIAEYWNWDRAWPVQPAEQGAAASIWLGMTACARRFGRCSCKRAAEPSLRSILIRCATCFTRRQGSPPPGGP